MKLPVISLAILGGQLAAAYSRSNGFNANLLNEFQVMYTGYDIVHHGFNPARLAEGYVPWVVKRFVLPIARPRVPLHGLPISFS